MNIEQLVMNKADLKGLSKKTIKTYLSALNKFFRIYKKDPREITKNDVESYLLQMKKWDKSPNTINLHYHALRFFYQQVLNKKLMVNVPCHKVRRKLPQFLTQHEIGRLFSQVRNIKHKLLLIFTYASGFRVGEVVKLKVKDLDLRAGYGWVRSGKGNKDRMFVIPSKLTPLIIEWIDSNNLNYDDYLFPGNKTHYSEASVRHILEEARQKARIHKKISPHSLRHTFATHFLENGYSMFELQALLGHASIETTMIYAHLARPKFMNVKSPYDCL